MFRAWKDRVADWSEMDADECFIHAAEAGHERFMGMLWRSLSRNCLGVPVVTRDHHMWRRMASNNHLNAIRWLCKKKVVPAVCHYSVASGAIEGGRIELLRTLEQEWKVDLGSMANACRFDGDAAASLDCLLTRGPLPDWVPRQLILWNGPEDEIVRLLGKVKPPYGDAWYYAVRKCKVLEVMMESEPCPSHLADYAADREAWDTVGFLATKGIVCLQVHNQVPIWNTECLRRTRASNRGAGGHGRAAKKSFVKTNA
jgi:hypothetical protein